MAGTVYVIRYGEHTKEELADAEVAQRLAAGLLNLAKMLQDPETKFVGPDQFKPGDPDNTWVHFSLVTDEAEDVLISPLRQFNAHLLIKYITDTTDFAGCLTAALEKG